MPTNLPDQNWTVPAGLDPADAPFGFTDFAGDVLQNVILRYPNVATRDAFNGSRVAGDISFIVGRTWYDRWTGSKWIPVTPIKVAKTANQVVNNSTTLVNDLHLVAALPAANTYYHVAIIARYTSSTTADIKFSLTLPAGATGFIGGPGLTTAAAGQTADADFEAVTIPAVRPYGGAGGATFTLVTLNATILTGANTGNCQLQWAQNALDATNTTIFAQSLMKIEAYQ
jgi:hypothetical protein